MFIAETAVALKIAFAIVALAMILFGIPLNAIGRGLLANNVVPGTRVSADGAPRFKPAGLTIDWTTVAAPGADVNLPEGGGAVIKAGTKFLRFGQVVTRITASGQFGPYDPAAADGRQNLTRGECYVLDETMTEYSGGISQLTSHNDQSGGFIDAGLIFIDRIIQSGVGAASLAAGPTLANFRAAFPMFREAKD